VISCPKQTVLLSSHSFLRPSGHFRACASLKVEEFLSIIAEADQASFGLRLLPSSHGEPAKAHLLLDVYEDRLNRLFTKLAERFADCLFAVTAGAGRYVFRDHNSGGDARKDRVERLFVVGRIGHVLRDDQTGILRQCVDRISQEVNPMILRNPVAQGRRQNGGSLSMVFNRVAIFPQNQAFFILARILTAGKENAPWHSAKAAG